MSTYAAQLNPAGVRWPWLLAGAVAWVPVVVLLHDHTLRTYLEAVRALPGYLLLGLAVGALNGAGQALAWPWPLGRRWLWGSVLGYGLALPVGLFLATLIPTVIWTLQGQTGSSLPLTVQAQGWGFMPFAAPGSVTFWPFPTSLILGGFVAGAFQWPAVRVWLGRSRPATLLLWVAGVWLGIALGLFTGAAVMTAALSAGLPTLLAMALYGATWGLTSTLVQLAVLAVLRRDVQRQRLNAGPSSAARSL